MASPARSLLWRSFRVHQVYGANTDVGKTIITTLLCNAAKSLRPNENVSYLKPVATGSLADTDMAYVLLEDDHIGEKNLSPFFCHNLIEQPFRHLLRFAPNIGSQTLVQYDEPTSPHTAAQLSGRVKPIPSDQSLNHQIWAHASQCASEAPGWLFVETAGGVHSPGPTGTTQADLYAPLRMPVILVGDSRLGGISQTVSAYESLQIRGYDIEAILLFDNHRYKNHTYLSRYFEERQGPIVRTVGEPPDRRMPQDLDDTAMLEYYTDPSHRAVADETVEHLDKRHDQRIARLDSMADLAYQQLWYPFTQQSLIKPESLTIIDSAHGDYFQTLVKPNQSPQLQNESRIHSDPELAGSPSQKGGGSLLRPSFDGSASWWTQGLGHANTQLTLATAYAWGRYGHVMYAETVHEPSLALAQLLLSGMRNPRLTRVFYSDNGSTGTEVAVKMGLRAAQVRYDGPSRGESKDKTPKLGVLGLKGSYHGDTIGAMNCSEPGTYNEKVEWYEGMGHWLDFPDVNCVDGKWVVEAPSHLKGQLGETRAYDSLSDIFDVEGREARGEGQAYERYFEECLCMLRSQSRRFGAVILEPIVLGAGGMRLCDPLYQRALVNTVRRSTELLGSFHREPSVTAEDSEDPHGWTGLPIIFDEVFTGLFRLGRFSASSFLGVDADISVHAKLLTGGLLPLSTTLASESIFRAFMSSDKTDALLHGHSYTAHPIGCQVALESLRTMQRMDEQGDWNWAKDAWADSRTPAQQTAAIAEAGVWSTWSNELVRDVSCHDKIRGAWALGSVLVIVMKTDSGSGYTSHAAYVLREEMLRGETADGWNVHCRVLGNVFYLMAGQSTKREEIQRLESRLWRILKHISK